MSSDNLSGADNQQETEATRRLLDPWWIVGFVDGEGCFSVAVHHNPRNARRTGGWQLTPVFQVYQHEDEYLLLEEHRLLVKAQDFMRFAEIVRSMRRREHWDPDGFDRLVEIAYSPPETEIAAAVLVPVIVTVLDILSLDSGTSLWSVKLKSVGVVSPTT